MLARRFLLTYPVLLLIAVCGLYSLVPHQDKVSNFQVLPSTFYSGTLVNHYFTGEGKVTLPNNDVYQGNFKNGRFEGKGTYISVQGWKYVGRFLEGKPVGKGTIVFSDNKAKTIHIS